MASTPVQQSAPIKTSTDDVSWQFAILGIIAGAVALFTGASSRDPFTSGLSIAIIVLVALGILALLALLAYMFALGTIRAISHAWASGQEAARTPTPATDIYLTDAQWDARERFWVSQGHTWDDRWNQPRERLFREHIGI